MISFKEYNLLMESFDSPWNLTRTHVYDRLIDLMERPGTTQREIFLNDEGTDVVFSHYYDNAYEIHHSRTDALFSTVMVGNTPNPRFVATMFILAKQLLEKHPSSLVRFVAADSIRIVKYHKLALLIAKRYKIVIGEIKEHQQPGYFEFLAKRSDSIPWFPAVHMEDKLMESLMEKYS